MQLLARLLTEVLAHMEQSQSCCLFPPGLPSSSMGAARWVLAEVCGHAGSLLSSGFEYLVSGPMPGPPPGEQQKAFNR